MTSAVFRGPRDHQWGVWPSIFRLVATTATVPKGLSAQTFKGTTKLRPGTALGKAATQALIAGNVSLFLMMFGL